MVRAIMIALGLALLLGCQDPGRSAGHAGDVLTIYGDIGTVDRGPSRGTMEPLFFANGIEFTAACVFSTASLNSLEQHTIRVGYPLGTEARRFSGPLLRDVLAIANPRGTHLTLTALDGYQRTISLDQAQAHDVILATHVDGVAVGVGGYGPIVLIWPRDTDPALAGMDDADWVWGLFAIESVTPDDI
tara:strand:+ start:24505 stop:25068 length:564 start_codon:yes stop_codon:yes gene_type:complete